MQRSVRGVLPSPEGHWVGDGFPVRSLFSYDKLNDHLSPFLLLDYAGPTEFAPGDRPRGVGVHPHRGFETVTIVYAGEVAHRDSSGGGGVIGPGDVQWMTAASGILHEEFHSPDFTAQGGRLEMAQLWVNLPARHKMSAPRYQSISHAAIPQVELPNGAGRLRVIAGEYERRCGSAQTFTELNVWDVRVVGAQTASLRVPPGHNAAIAVLRGEIIVQGHRAGSASVVLLNRDGEALDIEVPVGEDEAMLLLLSGAPIEEPVVGYGPFVMNSRREIEVALDDFNRGKFGRIAPSVVAAVSAS